MATTQATSQDFVSVRDIRENVVIQKNGQMCMILLASSINFALKSLDEQRAVLQQFQQFLNTIDFTLQIYIQSRRLNIEPYLLQLSELEDKQNNDLMSIQLQEYMEFIRSFTKGVDVMSKSFFVVVPYSPSKLNVSKGFNKIFETTKKTTALPDDARFEEHQIQLEQRIGVVTQGLSQVGVRTITLQKDDLVELFYHIYNPGDSTGSAPSGG
ncbi:MAG: type IV secretory pathway VirB4 component [Candidatus Paceibacteria bacterium]|jgi:type IV secretory pathway VirB4 component